MSDHENYSFGSVQLNSVQLFDVIAINPPYYKKQPRSDAEYAWCCGEHGEYFDKLFKSWETICIADSLALMILCDGCDLDMIHSIWRVAMDYGWICVFRKRNLLEENFIFKIEFDRNECCLHLILPIIYMFLSSRNIENYFEEQYILLRHERTANCIPMKKLYQLPEYRGIILISANG